MNRENINRYLNQLSIVPWVSRQVVAKAAEDELSSGSEATPPSRPAIPASPAGLKRDENGEHVSSPATSHVRNNESSAKDASPANDASNASNANNRSTVKPSPSLQNQQSIRLSASIFPPVIVLYSLQDNATMPNNEKELLRRMLAKCGIDLSNGVSVKDPTLVYPPIIPIIYSSVTQGENGLRDACSAFVTSLLTKWQCQWLIILGEETSLYLPQEYTTLQQNPIILENMQTMLAEPQTRKQAWELLSPLRDKLSISKSGDNKESKENSQQNNTDK